MEITKDKLRELMIKAFMTGKKTYLCDEPSAEFWVEEMIISEFADSANNTQEMQGSKSMASEPGVDVSSVPESPPLKPVTKNRQGSTRIASIVSDERALGSEASSPVDSEFKHKAKVVILDDNELSMAKYAEEYPENFKEISESKQEANK